MSAEPRICCLIVARSEEEHIFNVVSALNNQTFPLERIILVDDGSTDETASIAKKLGCDVIYLPPHEESLIGKPELAERWNSGLISVVRYSPDYVLLLGGDHVLPNNYVGDLLHKMPEEVVVASGRILGEPYTETAPRGSGRLVNAEFWMGVNKMQYPVSYGWESWLLFKAMQLGYETRCFWEITSKLERPTNIKKSTSPGKGMYALGYDWKNVVGRSLLTFLKSPGAGMQMFWGWLTHSGVERLDVAGYVGSIQSYRFWGRVWRIIKRGGRK